MSRRSKIALASFPALFLGLVIAGALMLRGGWFREQVRRRIVSEIEKTTGGRVELGAFDFNWRTLTAEVKHLVIHGTEPAGSAPLFRAAGVNARFRIVSVLKRTVDLESLSVQSPEVRLIVAPDGSTNIPQPKIRKASGEAMQRILDLAVRRFNLENGVIQLNSRRSAWNAWGENLRARFSYESARYKGGIAVRPLHTAWGDVAAFADLSLERNRITVSRAGLDTRRSHAEISGTIEDFAAPRGSLNYQIQLALEEADRSMSGTVESAGSARFTGPGDYSLNGKLRGAGLSFRRGDVRLANIRAETAIAADRQKIVLSGIRLSAPEGDFSGRAEIRGMDRFEVSGELRGIDARRVAVRAGRQPLPWNASVSGTLHAAGYTRRAFDASARLEIAPAPGSPPVHGVIEASYDGRRNTLDLARSWIALPSTRMEFSGVLGAGAQLDVHLHSTDLGDFSALRPAPIRLESGSATFDGAITGPLTDPRAAGRLLILNFVYQNQTVDRLTADVSAQKSGAAVQNASLTRGDVKAHFSGSIALRDWRPFDAASVSAAASIRNANVGDVMAIVYRKNTPAAGLLNLDARVAGNWSNPLVSATAQVRNTDVERLLAVVDGRIPATGTLNSIGRVSGSLRSPRVTAELSVTKGSIYGEPFDRLTASISTPDEASHAASVLLVGGAKQLQLKASWQHPAGSFEQGRMAFDMVSNSLPLEQLQLVRRRQPGASGSLRFKASGMLDVRQFQLASLSGEATLRDLKLDGKPIADARLTAETRDGTLHASLDSGIRAKGEWRLTRDYPGGGRITFFSIDFSALRNWLPPSKLTAGLAGSAAGDITFAGPALKPELWTATLEAPRFLITPRAPGFALSNSGPIRATLANSTVRIENARLVGRDTDIAVTGRVSLKAKSPLDIRVSGRLNLAVLQDFNRDLTASGVVLADASMRGEIGDPQVGGRLELKNAAFQVAGFPNGLANANGVIAFAGNRANIRGLTAESGGGKVSLSGFASIAGGELVFRLDANAAAVRFRYPPGVSTVADATLNLTGTSKRSLVSGAITINRLSFEPRTDLATLLSRSAQPAATPAIQTGLLEGVQLDVQVETAPDISVQSVLAQNIQTEASLRLRGSPVNPVLLGRIHVTQGTLNFFGNKYTISDGAISFYNPVKLEPILNIDLQTRTRGIDVTLTLSGPITKMNVTYRSDPPLQFYDIVALLATGRAPASDRLMLSQQPSSPAQSWQQVGASTLVGQTIASPEAGRLQRFFGVSKIKIDPLLTGVDNPQASARLTFEQQVNPNITFTYITNLSTSNPEIVRVEWAVNRQWSVIALRDENGLLGINFQFRKRFR